MVVSLQSHSQGLPHLQILVTRSTWSRETNTTNGHLLEAGQVVEQSLISSRPFKLVERGRLCMSRAWENEANKKILACSFVQNDASTIMRSITGLLQSLLVSQAIPFTKGVACETKCYMLQCQNAKDDEDLSKLSLTARSRMVWTLSHPFTATLRTFSRLSACNLESICMREYD